MDETRKKLTFRGGMFFALVPVVIYVFFCVVLFIIFKAFNMEALAIMVAKNICVEKYKRKQIGIAEANQDIEAGEGYAADGGIRAQETQMLIDTAIKSLSPRQQQLVRRRYIEDHSAEEIAAETGIPKPSVKSMLSTAKSKLIKILKKQ